VEPSAAAATGSAADRDARSASCHLRVSRRAQTAAQLCGRQRAAQHLRAIVGCGSRAPRKCCGICPRRRHERRSTHAPSYTARQLAPLRLLTLAYAAMPLRHGSAHCGCGRTASRSLAACDPRSSVCQRVRARRMGAAALMARPDRSGCAPLRPTRSRRKGCAPSTGGADDSSPHQRRLPRRRISILRSISDTRSSGACLAQRASGTCTGAHDSAAANGADHRALLRRTTMQEA
jgi:hypothetical protein